MTDVTFKPAAELAQLIRDRQIGCLELLDHYLERVDRFNPQLNAIIVQDADRARERARQADAALARGEVWGPLHGVPMTCKDSFNVAGLPTTFGSPQLKDNVAAEDALAIQRLKAAGAVIFGKTNVPLWLADFQSYNDVYGTTNNPWDPQRGPGGSSGGSAASLASGMTALEIGSDIGGSIRNPAHFCGVFGHKPTWGLLPPRGPRHAGHPGAVGPIRHWPIGAQRRGPRAQRAGHRRPGRVAAGRLPAGPASAQPNVAGRISRGGLEERRHRAGESGSGGASRGRCRGHLTGGRNGGRNGAAGVRGA